MGQPAAGQTGASAPISATLTAELLSSAPKRGDAAVAILSCADGSKRWAWQRKTVGYPVPSCVGKLCLFGGNREPSDESARGTLIRELREELPAAWIDEAVSSLAPVARFVISSSEAVMAPRPAYVFTCCVFHAFLPSVATQEDHVSEGSLELLSLDDLHRSAFCWGYDRVFESFIVERGSASFSAVPCTAPHSIVQRIAADADLGRWATSEAWQ